MMTKLLYLPTGEYISFRTNGVFVNDITCLPSVSKSKKLFFNNLNNLKPFVDYVNNHYIHSFFIRNEIIQPLLKEHIEIIND